MWASGASPSAAYAPSWRSAHEYTGLQQLHPDCLATQYQVPQAIIYAAITTLLEHGYLASTDGRVEAAQRQVTTGVFLPERSEQYRRSHERC